MDFPDTYKLTEQKERARQTMITNVGMRHDDKPCILIIDAKMAWNDGIKFYFGNEKVWLADKILSRYIRKM